MTNTGGGAVNRIFVKVFGFSDAERHALTGVFGISEAGPTAYVLWTTAAPEAAQVAVIDGDSWEAALELANPAHDALKLVWVGERPPARASLVFEHPVPWAVMLARMDALLAPDDGGPDDAFDLDLLSESGPLLDLDLETHSNATTEPVPLEPTAPVSGPGMVLVIDTDRHARLYLRARLAVAGMLQVDEAASAAQALQLIHTRLYRLVIANMELPDMGGWQLVRQVNASRPAVHCLLLTGSRLSWVDSLRGWFAGARGCLRKPLHPGKLQRLLSSVHQETGTRY